MKHKIFSFIVITLFSACTAQKVSIHQVQQEDQKSKKAPRVNLVPVSTGLDNLFEKNLNDIQGKAIGLVTNHSGIDKKGIPNYERFLNTDDVDLKVIFSPEHGLFGEAAAGEKVDYKGKIRTLPKVVSLYGKNRKPTQEMLEGLDILIYDIQDVGARFYTYISTLGLMMEAAAEAGIPVLVLDRPNPITGLYIEGPVLDLNHRSFVGYYPIPIRYGLTVGEIAKMIVGEKWISSSPVLKVIPLEGWTRDIWFDETDLPWVKPSPNIPDMETATVYPGLCLMEATNVNEGRGTSHPFKWIGAPWIDGQKLAGNLNKLNLPGVVFKPVQYTPKDIPGMANNPKFEGELCNGIHIIVNKRDEFRSVETGVILIMTLKMMYPEKVTFRPGSLNRLWGKDTFPGGSTEPDETRFSEKIKQYLIYE